MKRLLIPLLAALALPTAVNAGIPQSKQPSKWVRISDNYSIDTEDVKVQRGKIRFWVEREASKYERGDNDLTMSWIGKVTLNCDKFTARYDFKHSALAQFEEIKPNKITYYLANYFCFATGSEGYTRESQEPEWVKKIISNIEIKKVKKPKKVRNINCQSPVFKNKPICN